MQANFDRVKGNTSVSSHSRERSTDLTDRKSLPPPVTPKTEDSSRDRSSLPNMRLVAMKSAVPSGDPRIKNEYQNPQGTFDQSSKPKAPTGHSSSNKRLSYAESLNKSRFDAAVNTSSALQSAFASNALQPPPPLVRTGPRSALAPAGLRRSQSVRKSVRFDGEEDAGKSALANQVMPPPRPRSYISNTSGKSFMRLVNSATNAFKPGEVINAAHVSVRSRKHVIADTASVCESSVGDVISKYRYMIVIAVYKTHFLALPMYSHNRNGLAGKEDYYIEQHMMMKEAGVKLDEGTVNYTPYEPIEYYPTNSPSKVWNGTCVWVTRPVDVAYDQDIVRVGITREDFVRLTMVFRKLLSKGMGF